MEHSRQPRNKPKLHSQLIYDKGHKNIQSGKDNLFNKRRWENWTATCKRMYHCLTPYTKANSERLNRPKYNT